MPSCSGVGNASPVSITTIRPSYSSTVMFLPISPSPPRGRTRRVPLTLDLAQQALALEHRANGRDLAVVALDQRQPAAADLVAQELERGLRRHRERGGPERLEDVLQLLVDRPAIVGLVDHAAQLAPDDVRRDQDP